MATFTLGEVAAIVGGTLHGADPGTPVDPRTEFDSRRPIPRGGLFAAFVGEKVDGHDFGARAVADGAVAVLGSRPIAGVPTVVVDDPRDALGRLATAHLRRRPDLVTVGVTGSSGKTTTKDLITRMLARIGPTVGTEGSLNNELGAPYTALQVRDETRFLVLEMGAKGKGHIRYLCEIAPPTVAVVTNVGTSHLEGFGSQDGIAEAKGELVEALPAAGLAVLNADDHRVRGMAARTSARTVLAGVAGDAYLRAVDVALVERGCYRYTLVNGDERADVTLISPGRHMVGNSLQAAAVAIWLGMSLPDAAATLGDLAPLSTRRMDVFDRADGVTVIDDSYNANPASMAAALRALVTLAGGERRTWAVLGSMGELGAYEQAGHEEVGRLAAELGVDRLVAVGPQAAPIHEGAVAVEGWGGSSVLVTDQAAAVALVRGELRPGDVVLVKGSRYRTWDVVDSLRSSA